MKHTARYVFAMYHYNFVTHLPEHITSLKTESFAPFLVMTGFEDKVQSFPFLARWCVLANVPHNCNGTWQRHNRAVCFNKR
jgi:hypothetical protein